MFQTEEQHTQRPWGRTVPGMLEEQQGGLCGCSRVSEREREAVRVNRGGRSLLPPRIPAAPHLLLPPFLVLLQAPDLLKQAPPLLSQPHNLLVGIAVILFPRPHNPPPLHEAQGLSCLVLEPELPPSIPAPRARASLTGIGTLAGG